MLRPAALAALGLLAFTAIAHATPSSLVWIPSTDIQPNGVWHLGIDNYFSPEGGTRSPTFVQFTYGTLNGRGEVGIDYAGGQDFPVSFNAKYLVVKETGHGPAVVAGIYNAGTKRGVTDADMWYMLASKTGGDTRWSLGYCRGNPATLGEGADMLLAGVDVWLTHDRKWWGAIDYQSGRSAFGALNFGVAYYFTPNVSVIFGYDVYNNRTLNPHNTFTTQLDVNFK